MDIKGSLCGIAIRLTPEQKKEFLHYIPKKVYHTEKNVTILMALSQLGMLSMYLFGYRDIFYNERSVIYFSLYLFLFISCCVALVTYRYTMKTEQNKAFVLVRRIFSIILVLWILGISYVEQLGGGSLTVYFYFIPSLAAMLLMQPKESLFLFLTTWIGLICILFTVGNQPYMIFGDIVNSLFTTVLALYISYRYYRSVAIEFVDRHIIKTQYDEIDTKNKMLERLVHIDQLSDLYNRHYLTETIYPQFEVLQKENQYGVFIMCDIDYFKQYNDNYGHTQGDKCIQQIAKLLKAVCQQESAYPIRFGGEEFLIIKFTKTASDAQAFANQLLQSIRDSKIERTDGAQRYVSISLGVWFDALSSIENIEQAIKAADDALYAAKRQGRNRIVYAKKGE